MIETNGVRESRKSVQVPWHDDDDVNDEDDDIYLAIMSARCFWYVCKWNKYDIERE